MDKNEVRSAVEAFHERTAYGKSVADCFPPWYLHQMYQIPETKAIEQSSESFADESRVRGYDFGVDAFHLYESESMPTKLIIIQAKYSDSLRYISRGFKDFEKSLQQIKRTLGALGSDVPIENKVLVNLRATLNRLDSEVRKKLNIEFVVIHLYDEDHAIIGNRTRDAREHLKEAVGDSFPDRTCTIRDIGPSDIGPRQDIVAPSDWLTFTLEAVPLQVGVQDQARMYYGIGYLAELVNLYINRRDDLFSKNVRYFINKKRNIEKGAAGKMKQTLKQICISNNGGLEPEIFALYHNGVTVSARGVEPIEGGIRIREPYVVNGCQTIKNAYLFRCDQRYKDKINEDKWKRILVPLRILRTKKEDLLRDVTINNNRQNAISYAALRANEPVQIKLEERFRSAKIFYERQEGAFASLEDINPEIIEDEYENTRGRQVNIIDLARTVATAAGEISLARSPSDIFESDAAYNRCFSEKRLASITFLTFLQNLHDVIFVVLKKDLSLEQDGGGPKPGSLGYHAICLLLRYMAKKEEHEFILEFGGALWGRKDIFRSEITRLLDNRHSCIKRALKEKFLELEDSKAESLNDAFKRTESSLRLRNIDVFETFKNLDDKREDQED